MGTKHRLCAIVLVTYFVRAYAQMLTPMPGQHFDPIPPEITRSDEQWIASRISNWTPTQEQAWQSLDQGFRAWVTQLVRVREFIGHPRGVLDTQFLFHYASDCPVAPFAAPAHSIQTTMSFYENLMPNNNWTAWRKIDGHFRTLAEQEMDIEHATAEVAKAHRQWWRNNGNQIQACLDAEAQAQAQARTTQSISMASTAPSATPAAAPNERYRAIDSRVIGEHEKIDHTFAPVEVKQEAHEKIDAMGEIDKYTSDMDRSSRTH